MSSRKRDRERVTNNQTGMWLWLSGVGVEEEGGSEILGTEGQEQKGWFKYATEAAYRHRDIRKRQNQNQEPKTYRHCRTVDAAVCQSACHSAQFHQEEQSRPPSPCCSFPEGPSSGSGTLRARRWPRSETESPPTRTSRFLNGGRFNFDYFCSCCL